MTVNDHIITTLKFPFETLRLPLEFVSAVAVTKILDLFSHPPSLLGHE